MAQEKLNKYSFTYYIVGNNTIEIEAEDVEMAQNIFWNTDTSALVKDADFTKGFRLLAVDKLDEDGDPIQTCVLDGKERIEEEDFQDHDPDEVRMFYPPL